MHIVKLVTQPGPRQWTGVSANRANSIDGLNRITSVSGNAYSGACPKLDLGIPTATPAFAGAGLTTGDPVWSFAYDAENKLKLATANNGATVALAYQPDNMLTSTTESSGNITTSFLGACPREGGGWWQSGGGI
jgi:hypothetical protein